MNDPSPTPSVPGSFFIDGLTPNTFWQLSFLLLLLFLIGVGLVWAILRAARYAPPTMLIIVMSLMTVVLIGVYVFVDQEAGSRQVISTMAATSLGALVTAMSSQFTKHRQNGSDSEEPKEEEKDSDQL